jgi:phosphate transport system permease protein
MAGGISAEAGAAARAALSAPANLAMRKALDATFVVWGILATAMGLGVLAVLVVELFNDATPRLFADGTFASTWRFMTSPGSADADKAGILVALVGSLMMVATTALIAIPLGVAAGLYLEEYAPKNTFTAGLELTVNNLAGVPSIIYGLLALGLLVQSFQMGNTILVGAMTLAMLILPVIIVATREAMRAVPRGIRDAALSVGATKWMATKDHVLPYASPGIVTGVIIGISRALGETAPLIVIGVPTYNAMLPFLAPSDVGRPYFDQNGVEQSFTAVDVAASWQPFGAGGWLDETLTVLPMQMFNWTQRPSEAFVQNAAAAGIVLLTLTLLLNGAAIYLRYQMRKKVRW